MDAVPRESYAVVVMPVSAELPFPDGLDMRDDASFARGLAGATRTDCHSLPGAACAHGLHWIGGTGSRRRSGGFLAAIARTSAC